MTASAKTGFGWDLNQPFALAILGFDSCLQATGHTNHWSTQKQVLETKNNKSVWSYFIWISIFLTTNFYLKFVWWLFLGDQYLLTCNFYLKLAGCFLKDDDFRPTILSKFISNLFGDYFLRSKVVKLSNHNE